MHFLNYYSADKMAEHLLQYATVSPVLLKAVRSNKILIENNRFDGNVGLHGGALHVDFGD